MFGRVESPDVRDKNFPMRLMLDPARQQFPRERAPDGSRYHQPGRIWPQGYTGTCVEHGWRHYCEASPIRQPLPFPQFDYYRSIIQHDEFQGNDSEASGPVSGLQFGTSVRAGAEGLITLGIVKSYLWAETIEDVRGWLMLFGPVVIGFGWKSGMMQTDSEGFIRATGAEEGGHCTMFYGWNDFARYAGRRVQAVRMQQSWELPWGDDGKGRAWMLADEFEERMHSGGEVCAAVELRVKPVKPVTTATTV